MRSIFFEFFSGKGRGRMQWDSTILLPFTRIKNHTNDTKYQPCKTFLLLVAIFLLSACKTVPILDRNASDAGGYWEQDENTDPRFIHDAIAGNEEIGMLYAAGNHVMVNGARMDESSEISNNTFVSTGPQSGVRIEFKDDHRACLIQIQEFSIGRGYGDTASCQHNIGTPHANSQTRNSIYHFNISQQQTKVTVLRGAIKLALRTNPSQTVIVNGGEEAILTENSIIGPRPIPFEEIKRRVRWRNNYQFYKSEVDWVLVGGAAATAAAIGAAVILHKNDSDNDDPPPTRPTRPTQRDSTQPTTQSVPVQSAPPQTPTTQRPPVQRTPPQTPTTQRVPVQRTPPQTPTTQRPPVQSVPTQTPTTQRVPIQSTPTQTPTIQRIPVQRAPIQIQTIQDTKPVDCINNYDVNDCGPF